MSTNVGVFLKDTLKTIDLEILSSCYNSIEAIVQSKRIKKGHWMYWLWWSQFSHTNGLIPCLTEPSQMNALDLINSDGKERKTEEKKKKRTREILGKWIFVKQSNQFLWLSILTQEYSTRSFIK